jgi:uncharacterized protein YkwD
MSNRASRALRALRPPLGALAAALLTVVLAAPGAQAAARASAGCAGAGSVPAADELAQARSAVECLLDRTRLRRDLGGLRGRAALAEAASRHAADMVRRGFFAHVSPGGASVSDRARGAGYARGSWRVGEVIAWGTGARGTPEAAVAGWLRSPGHRALLLDGGFTDVGVGVAAGVPRSGGGRGVTYVVVFGSRGS